MSLILAIDTGTEVCSVGLFKHGALLDIIESSGGYKHAENLAVYCSDLLKRNQVSTSELSAVAIGKGPGSYTGLRIGVAFAKGICFAHQIPLISIDTLKSLAAGLKVEDRNDYLICPMIDARRMEVYTALFSSGLERLQETEAKIIEAESFSDLLEEKKIYFIGNGAAKCSEVIQHKQADFSQNISNSVAYMGSQIQQKWANAAFEDLAYFEPFYLKEFVAVKAKKMI